MWPRGWTGWPAKGRDRDVHAAREPEPKCAVHGVRKLAAHGGVARAFGQKVRGQYVHEQGLRQVAVCVHGQGGPYRGVAGWCMRTVACANTQNQNRWTRR